MRTDGFLILAQGSLTTTGVGKTNLVGCRLKLAAAALCASFEPLDIPL